MTKKKKWKAVLSASGLSYVIKDGKKQIASSSWHANSDYYPTQEETKANLRLAAAAPDLLEALKVLVAQVGRAAPDLEFFEPIVNARAAITKAEGRS